MKRIAAGLSAFLLFVSVASAAYTYFLTENLYTPNWSNWTVTGTMTPTWYAPGGYGGLGTGSSGYMVNKVQTYNGGEVRMTIRSDGSSAGFSSYLMAIPDSGGNLDYYQVAFGQNAVGLYKAWTDGSSNWQFAYLTSGSSPAFHDGTVTRAVARPDASGGNDIIAYVDNALVLWYHDTGVNLGPNGFMGVGVGIASGTGGTLISEADLGPLDTTAPNTIPSSSIGISAYTSHVELQWPAGIDDTNGVGVYGYQILRNGQVLTTTTTLSYSDNTVVPSTSYTYTLNVIDYHWNIASTTFNVSTPNIPTNPPYPSVTPDGRRVGVRPTGTYWGSGNENIDVMSGNVNFTLPLFKAQMRGGGSVPFGLAYNSQIWRQDSGGEWSFGADVGYGFGWNLLAGSITPVWNAGGYTAAYYLFSDSTGAQYRLNLNNNNVWSSQESVYVYFDANANILHFRDGSFWTFGCISAATEADSGVMHPTVMEDTNGNQILIRYQQAPGAPWVNSSARITQIEDVRATNRGGSVYASYDFTYNTDSPPHLTTITNSIGTGEAYNFTYSLGQAISSPMNGQSFGTAAFLDTAVVASLGLTHTFAYDSAGEITKITLPYGGYLGYAYWTIGYLSGNLTYRATSARYLSPDGTTANQLTYGFFTDTTTPTGYVHTYVGVTDPSGSGYKYWFFGQSGSSLGLTINYFGTLPTYVWKTESTFTWVQDAVGNSSIGTTVTALDPGQTYSSTKQTNQTVDVYGNVTQVQNYNYGTAGSASAGTLARTYNYSYLNSSQYTSLYILNRLTSATVTDGSNNLPLATNVW